MRHRRFALRILLLAFGVRMMLTGFASPTVSGSGEWTAAGMMLEARSGAAAVLLHDGRVLVTGGSGADGTAVSSAAIYDSALDTWTPAGEMTEPRVAHTASLLADGRVLIAGGGNGNVTSGTLEIFDPATSTFSALTAAAAITPRAGHAAATLADGRVMLAGGAAGPAALASIDIFNPADGTVVQAAMASPRAWSSATRLLNGSVLIAGGHDGQEDLSSAEIFDPVTNVSSVIGNTMATPRSGHQVWLLPDNNNVLIAGGSSAGAPLASTELFVPWANEFRLSGSLHEARTAAAAAPLAQEGRFLIAGGTGGVTLASLERYAFATLKTDKDDYSPGETVTITGQGWEPGETVTLVLSEAAPALHADRTLTAIADSNGRIFNNEFAPERHHIGVRFYLTATGTASTAQITFTDAELLTTELVGAVDDVTVEQGSTANFTIRLSASGAIKCTVTSANPATATVRTVYSLSSAGVLSSSTPSTPLPFYKGDPLGSSGNCQTIWNGAPTPYSVPATITAAAITPVGDYSIVLRSSLGTTTVTTPGTGNPNLSDDAETTITVHVVAAADSTPPVVTPTVSGTAGSNGWYVSDVTVSWAVSDPESSITSSSGCDTTTVNTDTAGTTITCTATSAGGTTTQSVTIKRDTSPPLATLSVTAGTAGTNGWYTSDVTVQTTGSDPTSGPVTCTADQFQTAETAGTPFNGSCTNDAGLTGDAAPLSIKLDKTGPSATLSVTAGTPGTNGWYTSDVTVHADGTDSISSPVTCTADQQQTTETAGTPFNGSCTNDAGLKADASPLTVKLDKTAPTAVSSSVTSGTLGTNGWYTSNVTVHTTGTEDISGPADCSADQVLTAETTGQTVEASCKNQAGLTADAAPLSIKLDKTGPSAALSVTAGTPGTNGWYTSDVTVHAAGTDTISSPVTCTGDQQQTTETTGTQFNGSCTNDAGLETDASPLTIKLDKTAPTGVSSSVTAGTVGANGWYTSNVTVHTTGTEDISGPADCSADQVLTAETTGQTVEASCKNQAGLTADAAPLSIKLDKTGPSAALSVTAGTPGANGWYTSDVTVHAAGTDTISSPVTCTGDQQQTTETAGAQFNGSCTNDAGLQTDASPLSVKLDKTAPTGVTLAVTAGTAGLNGWYVSNVTVTTTGSDSISAPVVCTNAQNQTTDTTGTAFNGSCTNNAGLVTDGAPLTVKVDKTAPEISLTTPADGASYLLNGSVNTQYACPDATSGPAACSGPVASGAALPTGVAGPHNFTVNATDNAGNTATRTNVYHVTFSTGTCLGELGHAVLQPINTDGTSVFKQKSTVPVKFRVCDANGVSIGANAVSSFNLVAVTYGTTITTVNEPVDSTTPDTTFRWDPSSQQWIFNTNTKSLSANRTYAFVITLTDASVIQYQFGLK